MSLARRVVSIQREGKPHRAPSTAEHAIALALCAPVCLVLHAGACAGEDATMRGDTRFAGPDGMLAGPQPTAASGVSPGLDRARYRDRLVGLWLAESIANWTGLTSEAQRVAAPYFTDDDWGTPQGNEWAAGTAAGRIDFNFLDPWGADDDTDIEFIYTWTMADAGTNRLTPEMIQEAWQKHTRPGEYLWVSNLAAQQLMRGSPAVLPPSTSLFAANDQSLMIDAQLTTEIFGAIAPGMPGLALELADLPISVTASGYAAHAAQFFVALYSLAAVCDPDLDDAAKVEWLVDTARLIVPDGSKAADVIDFVRNDYASNPDLGDWERTRDRVAVEFQSRALDNDYRYLEWYESSVNLATAVIALLYGQNDLRRTIQIGTLSGWDSDNGTATMGGLLGLLNGSEYVRAAFAERKLSQYYHIGRTRTGFAPDVVRFDEIADRLLPLVEQAIREGGGAVDRSGSYTLPSLALESLAAATHNPRFRSHLASVNNAEGSFPQVSIEGGRAQAPVGPAPAPDEVLADGLEFDASGRDRQLAARNAAEYASQPAEPRCIARTGSEDVTFSVTWATASTLSGIRFVEGWSNRDGGWLDGLTVEARVGTGWTRMTLAGAYDPNVDRAFEVHTLAFDAPVTATGIRVRGRPGGRLAFVTACELDGIRSLQPPAPVEDR